MITILMYRHRSPSPGAGLFKQLHRL